MSEKYEDVEKAVKLDLETNPRYEAFRERFIYKSTYESFCEFFTARKAGAFHYGKIYYNREQDELNDFLETGWQYLSYILQKKLFDIQCTWRAEKMTLPDIELGLQFKLWEDYIGTNPFTSAITDEEVEVLKRYVIQYNPFGYDSRLEDWQDYPLTEKIDDPDDTDWIHWYVFYNQQMNMPNYWDLYRNERGKKEYKYKVYKNGYDKELEEDKEDSGPGYEADLNSPKYTSGYNSEATEEFIEKFETPAFRHCRKAYESDNTIFCWDSEFYRATDLLSKSITLQPVKPHKVWYRGVIETARVYQNKCLCDGIDKAYAQYKQTGVFTWRKSASVSFWENAYKRERERIIKLRIERGEPGDLNF